MSSEMGNWSEQQEKKKDSKEKEKVRKETLTKYFLNLSQLTFVGLVVGVVVPLYSDAGDARNWYAAFTGSLMTIIFALIGNKILK